MCLSVIFLDSTPRRTPSRKFLPPLLPFCFLLAARIFTPCIFTFTTFPHRTESALFPSLLSISPDRSCKALAASIKYEDHSSAVLHLRAGRSYFKVQCLFFDMHNILQCDFLDALTINDSHLPCPQIDNKSLLQLVDTLSE